MTIIIFELKKIIKSKIIYLFIAISFIFVITTFISFKIQLDLVRSDLITPYQNLISDSRRKISNLDLLSDSTDESDKLNEIDNLKSEIISINKKAVNIIENIEKKQNNSFLENIKEEEKLITNFNENNYLTTYNIDPFYKNKSQLYEDKFLNYLLTHNLSYEDNNISINQPNFLFIIFKIINIPYVLILLLLLINVPFITDFYNGKHKFIIPELKGREIYQSFYYQIYQSILLVGMILVVIVLGLTLTSFWGEGLISTNQNSFDYPITFGEKNNVTTIGMYLLASAFTIIPFMIFLNNLLHLFIRCFNYSFYSIILFLLFNATLFYTADHLSYLQHSWNPWYLVNHFINDNSMSVYILNVVFLLFISLFLLVSFEDLIFKRRRNIK